jgi:hypothetical protein
MHGDEFNTITSPARNLLQEMGYFTIPSHPNTQAEVRLDMPAFERPDILGWKEGSFPFDFVAVESKDNIAGAIAQALVYQTLVPSVYIASDEDSSIFDLGLRKLGIGRILVHQEKATVVLHPNAPAVYDENKTGQVNQIACAFTAYHEFAAGNLGMSKRNIRDAVTYGVNLKGEEGLKQVPRQIWISDRPAGDGIQWSLVVRFDEQRIDFGLNIESCHALIKHLGWRTESQMTDLLKMIIAEMPKGSRIGFHRRCPLSCEKFKRGMKHDYYSEYHEPSMEIQDIEKDELEFMSKKVQNDRYIEFSVWARLPYDPTSLATLDPIDLFNTMNDAKVGCLDKIMDELGRSKA